MAVDGAGYWAAGYWAQGWWETGYWASPVPRIGLYGRVTLAPALGMAPPWLDPALEVDTMLIDPAIQGPLAVEPPYA